MSRPRRRRALGVSLLLPSLLVAHPGGGHAESQSAAAPLRKSAVKAQPGPERKVRAEAKAAPPKAAARPSIVHVVKSGDSVSKLAARYGVKRQTIVDANRLAHPERLRLGQRLFIPGGQAGTPDRAALRIERVEQGGDVLLVRAGSRRVPTRLSLVAPELESEEDALIWPVDGSMISPFGRRTSGWHAGLDIKSETGAPILAAADGEVTSSRWEGGYGNVIRIEHSNGLTTVYAHNLENLVSVGDHVKAGTIIATVGRTGRATTPHLHFETRYEGMAYNPLLLLPPREVIEVRAEDAPDETIESARVQPVGDEDHE